MNRNEKQTKVIVLWCHELMQDIRNEAFLQADGIKDATPDDKARLKDITEFNSREKVFRSMTLAVGMCADALFPFTKRWEPRNSLITDEYWESTSFRISLLVPKGFPETTYLYLKDLCHEFVVCKVLYDWTLTAMPALSVTWKARMDEARENIEKAANRRMGFVYRPLQPF